MSDEKIERYKGVVAISDRGIELRTMDDAERFARAVSAAGLAPKGMEKPAQILVAIQTGMEAGLTPMKALNSVVVINGVPSWKGDAARALVNTSGLLKQGTIVSTRVEGEGDARIGICWTWRAAEEEPKFSPRAEEGVVSVEWWAGERAIVQVAFPNLKPVLERAWKLLQE